MDLSRVVFAHAVNDAARLEAAFADEYCTILEADVLFASPDGTAPPTAMMGHDHASYASQPVCDRLSLSSWLQRVLSAPTPRGVKIDIKDHAAVTCVLECMQEYEHAYSEAHQNDDEMDAHAAAAAGTDSEVQQGEETVVQVVQPRTRTGRPMLKLYRRGAYFLRPAVIINADVLIGHASRPCVFNAMHAPLSRQAQVDAAKGFIDQVGTALPSAIISLGWTTCTCSETAFDPAHACSYSSDAVGDMLNVTQGLGESGVPFTFAVRASYVLADAAVLAPLVARFPLNSFTVWSPVEIPPRAFRPVRALLEPPRTMMDIPPDAEERRARARAARKTTYLFTAFLFGLAACALPTLRDVRVEDVVTGAAGVLAAVTASSAGIAAQVMRRVAAARGPGV